MTNREYILSLNDRQLATLLLRFKNVLWPYHDAKAKRRGNCGKLEEFNRYGWQVVVFTEPGTDKTARIPFHANDLLSVQLFLDEEYRPEYYKDIF